MTPFIRLEKVSRVSTLTSSYEAPHFLETLRGPVIKPWPETEKMLLLAFLPQSLRNKLLNLENLEITLKND